MYILRSILIVASCAFFIFFCGTVQYNSTCLVQFGGNSFSFFVNRFSFDYLRMSLFLATVPVVPYAVCLYAWKSLAERKVKGETVTEVGVFLASMS